MTTHLPLGFLVLPAILVLGDPSLAKSAEGTVPLANPGFEERVDGSEKPKAWSLQEWTGGEYDVRLESSPESRSGKRSAKVSWISGGSNILLSQAVPVRGGQRLRLAFYYRTVGRTSVSCSVRTLKGQKALQYNSAAPSSGTAEWTLKTFDFTPHPEAELLVIYLRNGAGTVWYDDVSLQEVPPPAPLLSVSSAARRAWEAFEPGTRVLNNLVTQLLDVRCDELSEEMAYRFVNPREGWVFFRSSPGPARTGAGVQVRLGHAPEGRILMEHPPDTGGALESMQFLAAGEHTITIHGRGDTGPHRLEVRTMPELICCEYESRASGREALMNRHPRLLDDYNVTLENFYRHRQKDITRTETMDPASERRLRKWRAGGRKALTHSVIPGIKAGGRVPIADTAAFWGSAAGFRFLDGIMCDEFSAETPEQLAVYRAAILALQADPRSRSKTIYAYASPAWGSGGATREFRETLLAAGHRLALEFYLREQPTETAARKNISGLLAKWVSSAELDLPGSAARIIVVLSCCSKSYYGMNCSPSVDFKVFLDLQFHALANEPEFAGLGGISAWILRYADDETVRWLGSLIRHYAIEGNKELLSERYGCTYTLSHITNADFADGLAGWETAPAEPGSVAVGKLPGLGVARGTMSTAPAGDSYLLLKRRGAETNSVSQRIRGLRPGRLYSVKMYSADHRAARGEPSENREHTLSIEIQGARELEALRAREVYDKAYGGRSVGSGGTWFNYHFRVFEARSETAMLRIGDRGGKEEGQPLQQELMINFVEVQPYFGPRLPGGPTGVRLIRHGPESYTR